MAKLGTDIERDLEEAKEELRAEYEEMRAEYEEIMKARLDERRHHYDWESHASNLHDAVERSKQEGARADLKNISKWTVVVGVTLSLILGGSYAVSRLIEVSVEIQLFVLGMASALGAAIAISRYLKPNQYVRGSRRQEFDAFNQIESLIAEMKLKNTGAESIQFTEQDKASVLASIQAKLESDALQSVVSSINDLALKRVRQESLEDKFDHTSRRLTQEVTDLAKRGTLNLILGVLTTLFGLTILGYSVFTLPLEANYTELLVYFVPRVSLVLLIEVFAYFFLRLYKQSLDEIKYFQNELTNVESKNLALRVALQKSDPALLSKVVIRLSATERNFVLEKGQTTVGIERDKLERKTIINVVEAIGDSLKQDKRNRG